MHFLGWNFEMRQCYRIDGRGFVVGLGARGTQATRNNTQQGAKTMSGMVIVAVGFVLVTAVMRLIDRVQLQRAVDRG